MKNRIIVSVTPEESSMALVVNGALQEYILERHNEEHIVGNIFKGRVKNLLQGIQAAFIDIGHDRNVFFYNGDKIALSEGQSIMIQVIKDAMGTKGPRAVAQPSLAGRYAVFLPHVSYIGISKNITDTAERSRLKNIAESERGECGGIIVRTAAVGCREEDLRRDIRSLTGLWHSVKARALRDQAPALLYREVNLPVRAVRDYLNGQIDELVTDDRETWQILSELVSFTYAGYNGRIIHHEQAGDIFAHYQVRSAIDKLNSRIVSLDCGGYLVFDYTEALTVIDVNTGSYKGAGKMEDTALLTNMQAVVEIARQIRLRDIGGIIIVDFIDMTEDANRKKILEKLNESLTGDRMKPRVLGITALGLVEMTRKKTRQNTAAALFTECCVCGGSGYVKSPETISVAIRREITAARGARSFLLQAHPSVADWFIKHELERLPHEKKVKVQATENLHPEIFTVTDMTV